MLHVTRLVVDGIDEVGEIAIAFFVNFFKRGCIRLLIYLFEIATEVTFSLKITICHYQ